MVHKLICEECGKEFTSKRKKRFCSRSCSAKSTNRKRRHSTESKLKTSATIRKRLHSDPISEVYTDQFCKNCGKEITTVTVKKEFCCMRCKFEYERAEKINNWLKEPEKYNTHYILDFIRDYLIEKSDNKCSKCGWSEVNQFTCKIPLQIHHIDGDCTNNRIENLEVLCPNCHSLTDNFCSRNKGKSKRKNR